MRLTQKLLTLAVSAILALPQPLLGQTPPPAPPQSSSGSEIPVAFQEVRMGGGAVGFLAVAPVPAESEAAVASQLASHNPDGTAILVSGPQDPVLKSVVKSGFVNRVKVFFARGEKIPAALKEKLNSVVQYAKNEKTGLMWAFYNASAITLLTSSSVDAGLAVLGGLFVWNSFLMTKSHVWESVMHKGGNILRDLVAKPLRAVGAELSDANKRFLEGNGQFGVAWAANIAVASSVMAGAGHFDSLAHAAFIGFLINYNVWDAVILKKQRLGVISRNFTKKYFAFQFLIGSLMEAATYMQIHEAQWILGITVVTGLTYLLGQEKIDASLTERSHALQAFFNRRSRISKCELHMQSVPQVWKEIQ